MRTRFVNCATHSGSDQAFAEAACESFDRGLQAISGLVAAAEAVAANIEPMSISEGRLLGALRAAVADVKAVKA